MKKEKLNKIKKELIYLAISFIIILIIFLFVFHNENFIANLKIVSALFILGPVPGYFLMYYWSERLRFTERIVIGTALALAITGIFSYQFGLIGIHIKYHGILFPIILSLVGIIINYNKVMK